MDDMEIYEDLKDAGVDPKPAMVIVKSIKSATRSEALSLVTKLQLGVSLTAAGTIITAIVWFVVGLQMEPKMGDVHNKIDKLEIKIDRIIDHLKNP